MVFGLDYDAVDKLTCTLASSHGFFDAVGELRRLCVASSSACISNADLATLVSLVEVAKGTMRRSGIRLHLFASCPAKLQEKKAAYFGLLRDLQRLSRYTRPESQELIERLSRLLFPLSTRFANGLQQAFGEEPPDHSVGQQTRKNCRSSTVMPSLQHCSYAVNGARTASPRPPGDPAHLMPPPPVASTVPLKRAHLSSGRILKWRNRLQSAERKQKYADNADSSSDLSESDSDEDLDSHPIFVPARSPLRNSFGIFCTGRGRGGGGGMGALRVHHRGRGIMRPIQSAKNAQRP